MIDESVENFSPYPEIPYVYNTMRFLPDYNNMVCALTQFFVITFFATCLTMFMGRRLKFTDKLIFWWFTFDAAIHTFFEGSFVFASLENQFTGGVANSNLPVLMTCVWTEYGKSDYRWLYGDPGVVCLEIVTVLMEAPLCWLILYLMLKKSPWRHPIQILICIGELYGLYMTFIPEWIYGSPNLDGSTFLYYWIYLGSNWPWLFVPLILTIQSMIVCAKAIQKTQKIENNKKIF